MALSGAWAQAPQLKEAGVCARCRVAQVLEWSVAAKHGWAGPNCAACHGAGCPKTGRREACASCHHAHALTNPQAPAKRAAMVAGERRVAGLEIAGAEFDGESGLARRVRVKGLGLEMRLVPGGRGAGPVHEIYVEPFYLGVTEVTQGEWEWARMENRSAVKGARLRVYWISWEEAREYVRRVNAKTGAGPFREMGAYAPRGAFLIWRGTWRSGVGRCCGRSRTRGGTDGRARERGCGWCGAGLTGIRRSRWSRSGGRSCPRGGASETARHRSRRIRCTSTGRRVSMW